MRKNTQMSNAGRTVVVGMGAACNGAASRYVGMLAATMGRWEEATRHFESALEMNQRIGARPFVAYTRYDDAQMLARRGDPGADLRASSLPDAALEIARELGVARLESKVLALRADVAGGTVVDA